VKCEASIPTPWHYSYSLLWAAFDAPKTTNNQSRVPYWQNPSTKVNVTITMLQPDVPTYAANLNINITR
jgi:hypothetical protein